MSDATAKAIGTIGIWIATAVILAFGVFRMNWNGDAALLIMFMTVVVVCGAAGISTAAVWGWTKRGSGAPPDEKQLGAEHDTSLDVPRDTHFRAP
jgi:hypothetical protein